MHRMYNITLTDNYISNECSYVSYTNLDSILDYSADHILCDIMQKIPSSGAGFIKRLCDKIKPGGIVVLTILDLTKICKKYISNHINGQELLSKIVNLSTAVSLEDIYAVVSQEISVQQIKYEDDSIIVALTKRGI